MPNNTLIVEFTVRSLHGRRNPDIVRSKKLGIRKLGLDFDTLQTCLFPGQGLEYHVVLIGEQLLQAFQIRLKADQSRGSERKTFPTRFISDFGESGKPSL